AGAIMSADFTQAASPQFLKQRFGQYNRHRRLPTSPRRGNHANVAAFIAALLNILPACQVNGRQGMGQSGNGLYTDMHYQWFTIGNTPLDATCVIGQVMPAVIFSMAQDIMYMRTRLACGGKTRANLYPLGRW